MVPNRVIRHENFIPVEPGGRRPLSVDERHWRRLCDVAEQVRRRTGARAWIDLRRAEIVFGYLRTDGTRALPGLPDLPLFRGGNQTDSPNVFDPALDVYSVDDVVSTLNLGRVPPEVKERWAVQQELRRQSEAASAVHRYVDDRRRERQRIIDRTFSRVGMGSHFKGRAVVNGLRGA